MTKTRTGDAFMPADEYGRALSKFSVNLLVRNVAVSLPFYREVLGASVRYADDDFAALSLLGTEFMLHADHAYDHHPLYARFKPRENAEWAWNLDSSAWIQTAWKNVPSRPVSRLCNQRRIFRMDGAKLRCWIPTVISGPWVCPFRARNECSRASWIHGLVMSSSCVLKAAGNSPIKQRGHR